MSDYVGLTGPRGPQREGRPPRDVVRVAYPLGKIGLGTYADGMVEHDAAVGRMLAKLDELGIADNTIVMYSTDNGNEAFSWPDGGTSPFRGEKDTNWEAGWRVPCMIRWPGVIKPGTVSNEIFAHEDMLPTLLVVAGVPDVKQKLLTGYEAGGKTFKVHLDGYDLLPLLKGEAKESHRKEMLYWTDDDDLMALRYENWKAISLSLPWMLLGAVLGGQARAPTSGLDLQRAPPRRMRHRRDACCLPRGLTHRPR